LGACRAVGVSPPHRPSHPANCTAHVPLSAWRCKMLAVRVMEWLRVATRPPGGLGVCLPGAGWIRCRGWPRLGPGGGVASGFRRACWGGRLPGALPSWRGLGSAYTRSWSRSHLAREWESLLSAALGRTAVYVGEPAAPSGGAVHSPDPGVELQFQLRGRLRDPLISVGGGGDAVHVLRAVTGLPRPPPGTRRAGRGGAPYAPEGISAVRRITGRPSLPAAATLLTLLLLEGRILRCSS